MVVENGYEQTEIGVIPEDWELANLGLKSKTISSGKSTTKSQQVGSYPIYGSTGIIGYDLKFDYDGEKILVARVGANAGAINIVEGEYNVSDNTLMISLASGVCLKYISYYLNNINLNRLVFGSGQPLITGSQLKEIKLPFPPLPEQTAIANALSDMDALIAQTEKLIEKKKAIKQGVMQELFKPKEGWVTKKLGEVCYNLDNLRMPLNDAQRQNMKGDIPYCGANGIVGYVNDFVIDDDIILMAEDGGYFDEYKTRPIAYRVKGKCWVNNHAHILKSKKENDQDFIFYSLVHKNILDFINGGTRAKLNKSEMLNITLDLPLNKIEQTEIAIILNEMYDYLSKLETKLTKLKTQKQGMMQALLTGKIRLI